MGVNKVVYGNNTLMDISDTTATESDVASGKSFYKANGTKATGTNSGGGGGSSTDVQINGVSITQNGVANIVTGMAYNESTNPITTQNDVYSLIAEVSQTQSFQDYIASLSDSGISVNTFEDLPTTNVQEHTKAYVKNATLYDTASLSSFNFDNTQMHDISPKEDLDFSTFTDSSDEFSINYKDALDVSFGVACSFISSTWVLSFGNANCGYLYSDDEISSEFVNFEKGWSYVNNQAGINIPITFNEIPLIPVHLMTVSSTNGNIMNSNYVFCDAKKHWAGEYRYIGGEWKYQRTIITPFIDTNPNNVPSSQLLYKIITINKDAINQIMQIIGG